MEYRVLGPLEVLRDGRPLDLGAPKQRTVLALLLLDAGRVVSVDRLLDAVWGDDHPPSATASLQAYVSNLRRILRDGDSVTSPIVRRMPGYLLDVRPEQLDLTHFRADADRAQAAVRDGRWADAVVAAEGALARWRGPLLSEVEDEEWVRLVATGLDERRTECVEDLVTALLGAGRATYALDLARQLHDAQPLRERACWLHVLALHRTGRTSDALEVYRAHVRILNTELGLEPGPTLRDLQSAILRQDAALLAWPAPTAPPPSAVEQQAAPPTAPTTTETLVGRHRELAEIDALLADLRAGTGRWALITGPAGIGKTRLAEEAVARWGGTVTRASCPEDDGVPPWWPIRQLIRGLGADPDVVLAAPADIDADAARYAVYERVHGLLAEATGRAPVLAFVDDVQWADASSLRFLTYLAAVPDPLLLAVILTMRDPSGPPCGDMPRLLTGIARRTGTRQLPVPPLLADEVAELVSTVSGEAVAVQEARDLTDRTGGNPFFVSEYARLPREDRAAGELPLAVRSVLGRRLGGLDPAVVEVLRAAAVLGDPLDLDLLRTVTRLDADDLADRLDEAADERIIVPAPGSGSYAFAHGLLRDEVLTGMSPVRLQRLHARAAEALGPGGPTERLVRRAAHLTAAVPMVDATEAYEACRTAATDAEHHWHSDSAAQWWGAASEVFDLLPPDRRSDAARDELLIARVNALAKAGRGQTVLDVVDAALLDAVRAGRTRSAGRLASTLLRTAGSWPWATYGADPGPLLARLAGVERRLVNDPVAHAQVLAALAVGSYYDPDSSVPDLLSARALELAEQTGDPDALADALLGRALTFSAIAGRAAESEAVLQRLAELPHEQAPVDDVLRHGMLWLAEFMMGNLDAAEEHHRLGAEGCDLLRLPVSRVQFRWAEGTLAHWRGDLDAAQAIYDHAYQLHRQTELYIGGAQYLAMLSLRWEEGRLDAALPPDEWAEDQEANPDVLDFTRAAQAAADGRVNDLDGLIGSALAHTALTTWTTHGKLTLLAHLTVDAGLTRHVPALLAALEPLAGQIANIGVIGVLSPVDLALARLHALAGDHDAAHRSLDAARALAERTGGQPTLLRCRLLAAQLAEAPDPAELRALAEEAEKAGLLGVAAEAIAYGRANGARVPRPGR
ncbi:BTAD domain-containing putative transcriptional regulator [Cryptosporangium aurantiacum]|uniref:Transcriptional regulator, SARP family n=1 Tax=Cryptosporangium aurantiacum TaxID=134849 RepID=A0A1M7QLK2_9ACTN|nr:BTAD domain-containing putative transcriptional regulator [Cryptosporangium aurantiacum]SHN32253.1 transcriptional regulator, SARP family [Cryptosporangium aurantiacum]